MDYDWQSAVDSVRSEIQSMKTDLEWYTDDQVRQLKSTVDWLEDKLQAALNRINDLEERTYRE